ncbi:MAG: hypothetical protein ACD_76C00106G0025 [uncultured bacterium]|nr:MAG: hypothetical protein ACD_76C00106G0025 [uncultured bacterium]HBD05573.1 GTPase Era [Candidatus Uhrbacteria bacterium]
MSEKENKLKSGIAVLIGRSNAGKSTLLNAIIGTKLSITSPKPQTTRMPIQGILTDDRGQIVFVDTPGLLKKARDPLTKKLADFVKQSLQDIQIIVYVADPTRDIGEEERALLRMIEPIKVPKILVLNKLDEKERPYLDFYKDESGLFDDMIEVSALHGKNLGLLKNKLFDFLPEGEFLYPKYQITNLPTEMWIAELIREKLFLRLHEEVPYSTHVEVEEINERENGVLYIKATILTNNLRHKSMIIGAGGRGIKEIGQSTRRELEPVMGKKIYLDLNVEHRPGWVGNL